MEGLMLKRWNLLKDEHKSMAQAGLLDIAVVIQFGLWSERQKLSFIKFAKKQSPVLYYESIEETQCKAH